MDNSDIISLRPIYRLDATDIAYKDAKTKSSYSVIKEECESRKLIGEFLIQEGNQFVVLHIDTAEADKYGVNRPEKTSHEYSDNLRKLVIQQINNWLNNELADKILYAVAVEEIDAWILTIYEKRDSSQAVDVKKRLDFVLGKIGINTTSNFENFIEISKPLSKRKEIRKGQFLKYNSSLNAFYLEIVAKVLPCMNNQPFLF